MEYYLDFDKKCCIFAVEFFDNGNPCWTDDSNDTIFLKLLTRTA
jgi:hypothetical protein